MCVKVAVAWVLVEPPLVRGGGLALVLGAVVGCGLHGSHLAPMSVVLRGEVIDLLCTRGSSTGTGGSNVRSCFSPRSGVGAWFWNCRRGHLDGGECAVGRFWLDSNCLPL